MNTATNLHTNPFLRAITETSADSILLVDSEEQVVFANRQACLTFGYEPEDLTDQNILKLFSFPELETSQPLQNLFSQKLAAPEPATSVEAFGQRKDGEVFLLELTVTPWLEQDQMLYSCFIRKPSGLKKKQEEMELLLASVEAISQATDFDQAIGITIRNVCNLTGWQLGEAWIPNPEQQLTYSSQWFAANETLAGFAAECAALQLAPGESMVGRAFQREVEWCPDVTALPKEEFNRGDLALKYGLRAGMALPISTNGEVLAVLAFFTSRSQNQDLALTKVISSVAKQLGSVLKRKKVEQKLKEKEEKYRTIFEKSSDPVLVLENGLFTDCNSATLQLLKLQDREEVVQRHPADLSPDTQPDGRDSRQKADEMIQLALENGSHRFEWVHRKQTGEDFWVEVSLTTIIKADKPILYTTWRDISDRKKTEETLDKQHEYLSTILENVEDGIVGCDEHGLITFFNRSARATHGCSEEPVPPEEWASKFGLFRPDGITPLRKEEIPLYKALQGQVVQNEEIIIANRNGTKRHVICIGRRILNKRGQSMGAVVVNHDITDRKHSEEELNQKNQEISQAYEEVKSSERELIQANSQLEKRVHLRTEELSAKNQELYNKNLELIRINSDLDNFVYIASHDLKVPLLNMEALLGILRTELVQENPESQFVFRKFEQAIRRMKQTIQDVTEVAKAQRKMVEWLEKVAFGPLLEEVKLSMENLIQSTGAVLRQDFEAAPTILYSQLNLKSILYNLLSNSLLYRSPNRSPEISIRTHKAEGFVVLTVKDNGLGINLDRGTEKLFGMFTRMHTHVDGSGIGLYIVNRLVQNQGGKIEVESEPNKGATFRIFLPDL